MKREILFDLNEISKESEYPVRDICKHIGSMARGHFDNPSKQQTTDTNLGIAEVIKDVETHGREDRQRLIKVRLKEGRLIIDTVDTPKAHSESNGFGRVILQAVYGNDYKSWVDDTGEYHSQLTIRPNTFQEEVKSQVAA